MCARTHRHTHINTRIILCYAYVFDRFVGEILGDNTCKCVYLEKKDEKKRDPRCIVILLEQ